MTEEEVTRHLDAVVDFINWADPDVLILQEVDRMALQSGYIDQVQYILDRTLAQLYASQHRADFLPTDGMGYIDFGNATFSKVADIGEASGLHCLLWVSIRDITNTLLKATYSAPK